MKTITIIGLLGAFTTSAVANIHPDVLALGEVTYSACVACHGPDGKGVKTGPLVMAPSLLESEIVKGDTEALALVVLKGIKKENADYVQQMLALQEALDDKALAAVMTYVRHTFAGHKDEVTDKQVGKWRKQFSKVPPAVARGDVNGILIGVAGAERLVSNLTWKVYKGSWNKLPDFDKLTPVASGESKNGLVDIGVAKMKDSFGMVFNSTLHIPKEDTYEFTIASDDGSDLWIDGKRLVLNDGIHPVSSKSGKLKLSAGPHALKISYFEGGGQEDLMVAVKAKSIGGTVNLSKKPVSGGGGGGRQAASIPLSPSAQEAVMYRNFISGANPRGIAVGYPGGWNLCWDADVMNVAMIWRGEFMDAGRHRSGRGQGAQSPSGDDVTKVAEGFPLMVVSSPEQTWETGAYKVMYPYARDSADRNTEKSFIGRHPDYRFKGYRLNPQRFPTFKYGFQDLEVRDGFTVEGGTLVRTLTFSGSAAANTLFRVAREASPQGDLLTVGGLNITVQGAAVEMRNKDAVVPVKDGTTLTLRYAWAN